MDNPFARYTFADLVGRRTLKWQAYPPEVIPMWVAEMDTDLAEPVRALRRNQPLVPAESIAPSAALSIPLDANSSRIRGFDTEKLLRHR